LGGKWSTFEEIELITEDQLVRPVLEILHETPKGELTTTELRQAVKDRLSLTNEDFKPLSNRPDFRIDQIVRNLKSHRKTQGNPFSEGLLKNVRRGFKIAAKGRKALDK
jgi:hypothetical protein